MRSRAGYWIGGGLVAAGVVGAVLWFVLSFMNLDNEIDGFQRVPLPGDRTVQLDARKYVIYYEGPNADESVPQFEIAVTDSATERPLAIDSYGGSLTYSFGDEGTAQATVTPTRTGAYAVRTSGGDGTSGAQVAFGRSIAGSILRSILGVFAIGGVLIAAGVILLVVTSVRRRRAGTAAAATAAPAAPTWPP